MIGHQLTLFEGVPDGEIAPVLERLALRRFPAGSVLLAEGDTPRVLYIIRAGTVEVTVRDRAGRYHAVNRLGPGATVGEMSLFTGRPASATVRALADVEALVMAEDEFHRSAAAIPRLYRNVAVILSHRLEDSNRRPLRRGNQRWTILQDDGAPPEVAYALAAAVAWHARAPVLLVLLGGPPAAEFPAPHGQELEDATALSRIVVREARAALVRLPCEEAASPALAAVLEELCDRFEYVLVFVRGASSLAESTRRVWLTPAAGLLPDGETYAGGLRVAAWARSAPPINPSRDGVLHVPALAGADQQSLTAGVLPPATAAGRALGWAARDLLQLKVGVALGAGSVKGYAHLGALRVLERAGVPADFIVGSSIGAAVATLFASGVSLDSAARQLDEFGALAFRPTLPLLGLLSSSGVRGGLRRALGDRRIEDLPMPLAIVAADLVTQQQVVFRRGLIWPPLLASMSIPGVYPPQRMGPYLLVDGGVVNPVPSGVAAAMGADVVIAIKLGSRPSDAAMPAPDRRPRKSPSVVQTILRSIEAMQVKITTDTAATATFVIEPDTPEVAGVGLRHFSHGRRYIAAGEAAAMAALPRLEAALPWLRTPERSI